MPGRVFRNEAISARAHCMFHQIEGLYIAENVSFADLKQTLLHFAKRFFGPETKIRLRPSYFPFTEPSAEVDVYWGLETEVDKRITKGTGWLEILGCGMVDPNVLEASGIDSKKYSGFAFGMGIERITMLRYQIGDLRLFFENDKRFLDQFARRNIHRCNTSKHIDIEDLKQKVRTSVENKEVVSYAFLGNVVEVWEEFDKAGIYVDLGSDQT